MIDWEDWLWPMVLLILGALLIVAIAWGAHEGGIRKTTERAQYDKACIESGGTPIRATDLTTCIKS